MTRLFRPSLVCLALPLAITFSSCGDGLDSPTFGTGASSTPTPTPRPSGTASATPTPAATPTPSPSTALKCELSSRPDCGFTRCCSEGGGNSYVAAINDGQADLERTRPELFGPGGTLRVNEETYTEILAAKITAMTGICAIGGGGGSSRSKDEIGLKRDNNQSTNVDVIIGSSNTTYIGGVYNCRPAAF